MSFTAPPKDSDAVLLQSNITALTASISATSSTLTKEKLKDKLDQLQRELVYHYLDTGRLTAANILSTMT